MITPWRSREMLLKFSLAILICCASDNLYGQAKTPASGGTPQVQKEFADLRSQVVRLAQKVDSLERKLELHGLLIKGKQDRQDSVSLDLTEHTFQRLDTDNGFFLISVVDAEPYLTGYKLHLHIGNPSYASYSAAKLKVRWNKRYEYEKYTETSFAEWQKAFQEKEISLTDTLDAGRWNNVELIIAPATTEQLGIVTLSMSTDTVMLTSR